MSIDRLTAEDRLMLWPDEIWPQDMGAMAVLESPHGFDIDRVRQVVAGRLDRVPRLRQLLYVPPPELGGPLWIDDVDFDISRHVREQPLDPPGGEAQLLAAVAELWQQRLDRSRPLWGMCLLTGMPDGRLGLFVRLHHTVGDGMAGVATLASLLDSEPDVTIEAAPRWTPSPAPAESRLAADERTSRQKARALRWSRLGHPLQTIRDLGSAVGALRELVAGPSLPPTSLTRLVGQGRRVAAVRARTDTVVAIAHEYGVKVNDVLLDVTAGGLRRLLAARGERIGDVMRVYVPISLRQGRYAGARGNEIAQMVVQLPVGIQDAVERLHVIAAETARRKARVRPSLGALPFHGWTGRAILKLIDRQRVNVTTADLPGPPLPLYLAGARLIEVFPMLPLIGKVSLGVGALSYAGQFGIMASADREAYPDLDVFASGMDGELAMLESTLRREAVA